MGRGKGGSTLNNKRFPGGISTTSNMSKVGEIEAKHGVLGEDKTTGSPELNNEHQLPDGATLKNAKIYDNSASNVDDLVKGFLKGEYLVHARVKDGTDFKDGIEPSAGEFLRSTEQWQTAAEMHNKGTELTFFGDKDSDIDSWAKYFAEKGKPIEMVFVKKEPDIIKSLGDGMVETAEGKVVPYEQSQVFDYDDARYRELPAGVETGDWFTKDIQSVVGVLDYALPVVEQQETLSSADFVHDLGDNVKTKKTIEPNRIEVLGKYEPDINFNDKTVTFDGTPPRGEEGYLYHSTFAQNVDPILNEGIVPNKSNNWGDWSEKGYSYFAKSPEDALQWSKDLYEEQLRDTGDVKEVDDIAILKIKLDEEESKVIDQHEAVGDKGASFKLQKQWEAENDTEWDEDEYGEFPAHTSDIVKDELAPYIVEAAQREYDKWDEEDVDTYAGGGICHYIAENIAELLSNKGINAFTVSSNFEQHVYVVAQFADGVYSIDIPYQNYETGGGFSWKKLPDVEFSQKDISLYPISADPRDIKEQEDF